MPTEKLSFIVNIEVDSDLVEYIEKTEMENDIAESIVSRSPYSDKFIKVEVVKND